MYVPSRIVRHAIAMTTAARHADEPGGRDKLTAVLNGEDCVTNRLALVTVARLLAGHVTDEQLQEAGLELAVNEGMRKL